jgi:hypothetical protein
MGQFRQFLNEAALQEIHLRGHLFTWSDKHLHPTLECTDRAFMSNEWEALQLNCDLQSLSSLCLDHAPLLLTLDAEFLACKHFHFRSFWLCFPSFLNVIKRAWNYLLHNTSPFAQLDWLLRHTASVLKSWSDCSIGSVRS